MICLYVVVTCAVICVLIFVLEDRISRICTLQESIVNQQPLQRPRGWEAG